ncbi:uncharacterized protein [Dermacentor andersoni]|uniref:uncharacterized protein n=1 Tax=Dermacentor andersoni TaxID=34620 RepID=UPI002417411D|nr:uncharacterized protein LOC129380620 isoform X2 [Dermacentor andersoni]
MPGRSILKTKWVIPLDETQAESFSASTITASRVPAREPSSAANPSPATIFPSAWCPSGGSRPRTTEPPQSNIFSQMIIGGKHDGKLWWTKRQAVATPGAGA